MFMKDLISNVEIKTPRSTICELYALLNVYDILPAQVTRACESKINDHRVPVTNWEAHAPGRRTANPPNLHTQLRAHVLAVQRDIEG